MLEDFPAIRRWLRTSAKNDVRKLVNRLAIYTAGIVAAAIATVIVHRYGDSAMRTMATHSRRCCGSSAAYFVPAFAATFVVITPALLLIRGLFRRFKNDV